jgi:hypothetical protein
MRRNKAVTAAVQYCGFHEGGPLRGRPKRPTSDDGELIADPPTNADPPAEKQKRPERSTVSVWENNWCHQGKGGRGEETLQVIPSAGSHVHLL